jgi:uncharacterized protein
VKSKKYGLLTLSEKDTRDRITIEQLEQKMFEALQKLGVDTEKKLKVVDVFSNYRDYLLKKTDVVKSKRYELEVSTAATAGRVLLELEKLGISNIHVARLDHTRKKEFEQIVRQRSVVDAARNAALIASTLNQKIGLAIHVVEADNVVRSHAQSELRIRGRVVESAAFAPEDLTFRPIELEKTVHIKFMLQ